MVFMHANFGGKCRKSKVRYGMFLDPFMRISYMSLYQKTVILKPSLLPHRSS